MFESGNLRDTSQYFNPVTGCFQKRKKKEKKFLDLNLKILNLYLRILSLNLNIRKFEMKICKIL